MPKLVGCNKRRGGCLIHGQDCRLFDPSPVPRKTEEHKHKREQGKQEKADDEE